MSVNHYLLPVTDEELISVLATPETIWTLLQSREDEVCSLWTNAQAIMFLVAEDANDPLLFLEQGPPPPEAGWVGRYEEEDGRVLECELDMGYGPAWYCRSSFLAVVSERLDSWTLDRFSGHCDLDLLEEESIYPTGWHDPGRREELLQAFVDFRTCIMSAASSGRHLLVWCA